MSHPSKALQYAIKFAQDALSPPPVGGGIRPSVSYDPNTDPAVIGGRTIQRGISAPQASPASGSPGHDVWNMGDPSVGSLENAAPAGMAGGQAPAWGAYDPSAIPLHSGQRQQLSFLSGMPTPTPPEAPAQPYGSLEDVVGQGPSMGAYDPFAQSLSAGERAEIGVPDPSRVAGTLGDAMADHSGKVSPGLSGQVKSPLDKISAYLAEHMFLPELLGMQKTASGLPREQDRLAMAMAFGSALAEQDLAPLRKLAMKVSVDLMTKRAQDISPEVAHALLGGGLGAAAGGLAGYGLSDKKNRGRNALLAAIVGGAGGAAAGHHFSDQLPDVTGTRGEGGGVSKVLEKVRKARASSEARGRTSDIDQAIRSGLHRGLPPGVTMRKVSPREGRPDVIGESRERLPFYRAPMPSGVRMRETLLPEGYQQETPHGGGASGGLGEEHMRALRRARSR